MQPLDPTDFSKDIPLLQLNWSANSLNLLKTCPRKYMLEKILGWRSKRTSVHLEFGAHYADAIEHYHIQRANGADTNTALRSTVRFCLSRGTRDADNVFTPWDNEDGNKNRFTLVRAIVWYFDKFENDPAKTVTLANGKPAVELPFKFGTEVTAPDGNEYTIHGYLDRLVEFGNDIFVSDNKTTKGTLGDYYFAQFNPNTQMATYIAAGQICFQSKVKGVIVDAAQLAVGFARFSRHITYRTSKQLEEWMQETIQWFRVAELHAQSGCYPMNENACDKYGGCPFRGICSADPAVRETFLRSGFEQKVRTPKKARSED